MKHHRQFTAIEGVGVHWVEVGTGRPTLLLHGLADSHLAWLPLSERLPGRRLMLLDLPGHGLSDRPDAAYEVGWYADVVGGFVDRLGLEDLDVVGHSYGGAVAQHLLLSRRERVRTLALLAPGGWGRNVGIGLHALRVLPEWLLQPLLGAGTRLAFAAMAPANAPHAEWLASRPSSARALIRTARAAVDARGARILASDFVDRLTELPPTLMLWGDRDRVLPVSHAHRAASWIPGLDLRIYSGCGHFPHLERTDAVAADLGRFYEASPLSLRMSVPVEPPRASWIVRAARGVGRFFARLFGR